MAANDPAQISRLYHEALGLSLSERAAYLARACGADAKLRQEVESLLSQDADVFLADGVAAMAAPMLTGDASTMTGRTIGSYVIGAPLGAGGMGEVYRARDTKLGRDVAVKILPRAFTTDPKRLGRFEREARVLASLNHPHIAAIYGIEAYDGVPALVLELVEGGTLANRLLRGPLPVPEALRIARQIADAFEAAHEKGIVHRDLKPSNVALTRDGAVKVLDFGLAKGGATDSETNLTQSPTFTIGGTRDGVLLGTAPYMSPEQARGHVADRRADLWAFGCVLFEMLTGRMAFPGATTSDHIAAVLEREADWAALPAGMPAAIHRLLRRCLEKDRMRRLDSAAAARLDIDDALASPATERAMSRPLTLTHLAVAVVVGALMIAGTLAWRAADRGPMTPTYVSLDAPTDYVLGEDDFLAPLPTRTPMVFAPDGRSLIIQAAHAGKPQLFLRSLDRPDAKPIAGTDGARVPFVSPDGKWVGFLADNELRKVPIEGGTPTTICRLSVILGPNGAAWGARDVIVFGESVFGGGGRIMRVSAGGGTPVPVTAIPAPRRQHVAPFFLPDGTRFLFSDVSILDPADARLMVQSLDGGVARLLVASATDGRFLPTGRLAFMRLGTLMTAAFDLVRAEIVGDPVAALGGVMQSGLRLRAGANNTGAGMFAVSSLGALAAIRGPLIGGEENHLIWVTGDGRSSPAEPAAGIPAGGRLNARISPDRSRAIVTVLTPTRFEHWLADWTRDVWTLCSDCGGADSLASLIWSPDGRRLLFSRNETLVTHALDGSTAEQVIVREPDRELSPTAWLTDGRIVYTSKSPSQPPEFEVKLMEAGGRAGRVVLPLGTGLQPDVSHDGHWLAYASAVGDQGNIVVQAFPGPGSRTTVSAGGGQDPVWSADGRTLYYLKGDRGGTAAFAIDITVAGDALTAGTPRELFRHPDSQTSTPRSHDVLDGPRFLLKDRSMSKRASVTRMDLVLNWTSTLPKGR